jgi:anti-sigma factor (TIGR02949 family)
VSAPAREQLDDLGLSSTCVEVLRHLWDYLDDELPSRGTERLRAHIASCTTCRDYQGYQACFLDALSKLRTDFDAPRALRERLAEKLKGQGCGCWDKVRKEQS